MTSTPHNITGLYREDSKIRTFTGRFIDVFNPNPDDICIEDIAHALTNQCRFAGHTKRRVSVAQHSVMVADLVPPEHKLAALLHDASEAYLADIPTPIKRKLVEYQFIEDDLMKVIAKKFGFTYPLHEVVKEADKHMLEWEWSNAVINDLIAPWHSHYTETLFLWRFREFTYQIQ